jgi:hypothetical protein
MAKKAFIVGAVYPPPYYLQETVNDVANWLATLTGRGFSQISVKNSAEATTRDALRISIRDFIQSLVAGDSAAIVLIGHGGRIADINGDEADGLDECYVSSDLLPISDDEIGDLLGDAPPGTAIDIVLEYCYAGAPDQPLMPGFSRDYPASDAPREFYRSWGAGMENELTYEVLSGGLWQSLFSLYLCWALRSYPLKNANEIIGIVGAYVTAAVPGQHPVLAGENTWQVPF